VAGQSWVLVKSFTKKYVLSLDSQLAKRKALSYLADVYIRVVTLPVCRQLHYAATGQDKH